ncbi:hypothetical protein H072_9156 [Dactylellina haptotyla CBS 200.50]|uniref:C2H2-type domain-containing protein n=1 Tax=Dactylellina haptotyla (strain CBS 200.50) TaxID=1284197 RepID=S8A7U2_DACHA|nr:hypothetical protein H072_9156 [Dactylellina haptotyla CBS 200.50]
MSKRPRRDSSSSSSSHDPSTLPDADYPSPSPTPPPRLISPPPAKYTRSSHSPAPSTMTTTTSSTNAQSSTIKCTLPSCPHREHTSIESFESHYQKYHTNRCHDCLKNFPTARILECHIRENHDMFAVVAKEKGEKIYACFVEDCDKVCVSWGKRRAHLVDKHYYHKNFNFFIVNEGIDRATSLLTTSPPRKSRTRVRRVSEASSLNNTGMEIDTPASPTARRPKPAGHPKHARSASESQIVTVKEVKIEEDTVMQSEDASGESKTQAKKDEDLDMTDLTSRMSAIRFVPPSVVRFGRRGGGSGFGKK